MIKIIFTDVDGTLFNSYSKLCEPNRIACLKAQDQGVPVVITTGRYGANAINVAKEIAADKNSGYVIGNDGSEIWSFKDNKWIYLKQLPQKISHELYEWLFNYSQDFILNFNCIKELYINRLYNKWASWVQHLGVDIIKIKHFSDIKEPVSKVMVILEKYWEIHKINKFINDFEKKFPGLTMVQYHINVFSIGPKDISKGSAIKWLCNYLSISTDQALAIGDSFNDLTMFETVGYPVVMDNAHEAIKTYAKWIAPNNDDSGVAHTLNHYLFKNNN